MKKINLFLLLALPLFACVNLHAQVTIGGLTEPAAGAVLDLNSTAKGGLLLSNVAITDWELIPHDATVFPGITDDDVNLALRGAMVYNTGTANVPQGIYIWNGCRWTQDGSYGTAVTSSSYSVTAIAGNSATLTVTGSGCPTLSYQWFSNLSASNSGGSSILNATNETYITPALSLGTPYYYYCEVTSSLNGSKAVSDVFTVTVNINPATIPFGSGSLTGKTCLDVALGNLGPCGDPFGRQGQKIDFNDRTGGANSGIQTYTFTPSGGTVSNVRFEYIEESGSSIESITPGGNYSGDVTGACTVVVSYKESLQSGLAETTRDNGNKLKLYAVYNNKQVGAGGSDERVALNISLQDCSCCGAFVDNGQWLNFMCYNLGADESADPFIPSAAIYGAKYKWGNAVASVTQAEDQDPGAIIDWASRGTAHDGTDWNMNTANPCPAGWKVPSEAEWQAVLNNNSIAYSTISNETFTGWASSGAGWAGNAAAAVKIGDALVLPAAGWREYSALYRGIYGYYWTSNMFDFYSSMIMNFESNRLYIAHVSKDWDVGFSIRCVAE